MRLVQIETCDASCFVFEVFGDTNTAHEGKQFIVVNMDEANPELRLKKALIAHFLGGLALRDQSTDWRIIDMEIAGIMDARIHSI